jgi:hypothetical protein
MPGTQRFVPPQRQPANDDDEEEEEDDPNPPNPPVFTFPGAPGQQGPPGAFNPPPAMQGQPMQPMIVNPQGGQQPQTITINPAMPGNYPTASPFGSTTPGTINQPVAQPGQPGVVTRPPGRQQQ